MEKTKRKYLFKVLFLSIGFLMLSFGLLSDFFRKRPFLLGFSQLSLALLGLFSIAIGFFYKKMTCFAKQLSTSQRFFDGFVLVLFLVYSTLFFIGKWNGLSPTPEFSSDAASITGYAVAYDHPENFRNDLLIGNVDHSLPYRLFLVPILSLLTKVTQDYSLSFLFFLPLSIFFQLFGFYLVGKKVLGSNFPALLFSVICGITIPYGAGDYWGFFRDPQPRLVFQAVLPYVLLLCLNSSDTPKRWPFVMLVTGVMGYIHLLSGSAIAFMSWLSFFLWRPKDYSIRKLIGIQSLNGLVYLLVTIPVLLIYGRSTTGYFVDVANIVRDYFLNRFYFFLFPLTAATVLAFFVAHRKLGGTLKILFLWLFSIYVVAIFIPLSEYVIWGSSGSKFLPMDLVRNLRYTFPLLYLLIYYCFLNILKKTPFCVARKSLLINLMLFFISLPMGVALHRGFESSTYYFKDFAGEAIACFRTKQLFCPSQLQVSTQEVLLFIRAKLPLDASILSVPSNRFGEQIRYGGERTSAFVETDIARLSSSEIDYQRELSDSFATIQKEVGVNQIREIVDFACSIRAGYLLLDTEYPAEVLKDGQLRINSIFSNKNFDLVEIDKCP
jgi:hypothetical protein